MEVLVSGRHVTDIFVFRNTDPLNSMRPPVTNGDLLVLARGVEQVIGRGPRAPLRSKPQATVLMAVSGRSRLGGLTQFSATGSSPPPRVGTAPPLGGWDPFAVHRPFPERDRAVDCEPSSVTVR